MAISYEPLLKLLIERNMKRTDLLQIMSSATLAKLSANKCVNLKTIDDICIFLDCDITDVVRHRH